MNKESNPTVGQEGANEDTPNKSPLDFTISGSAIADLSKQKTLNTNNMNEIEKAAASNATESNNAANNAAGTNNFNTNNMTEEILAEETTPKSELTVNADLDGAYAKEQDDELPIEILPEIISNICTLLKKSWTRIILSFHQQKGNRFYVKLQFNNSKTSIVQWSAADEALMNAIIFGLRGKFALIESYKPKDHQVLRSDEDIVLAIFKSFMSSRTHRYIGRDFTTKNGLTYKKVIFTMARNKLVRFYVKATTESEQLINNALFGEAV